MGTRPGPRSDWRVSANHFHHHHLHSIDHRLLVGYQLETMNQEKSAFVKYSKILLFQETHPKLTRTDWLDQLSSRSQSHFVNPLQHQKSPEENCWILAGEECVRHGNSFEETFRESIRLALCTYQTGPCGPEPLLRMMISFVSNPHSLFTFSDSLGPKIARVCQMIS